MNKRRQNKRGIFAVSVVCGVLQVEGYDELSMLCKVNQVINCKSIFLNSSLNVNKS